MPETTCGAAIRGVESRDRQALFGGVPYFTASQHQGQGTQTMETRRWRTVWRERYRAPHQTVSTTGAAVSHVTIFRSSTKIA